MRWYVVLTPDPPLRPFVLSEWTDDMFAVQEAVSWRAAAIVGDDGPHEFADAIAAWKVGNDAAYAQWLAVEAAAAAHHEPDDSIVFGTASDEIERAYSLRGEAE